MSRRETERQDSACSSGTRERESDGAGGDSPVGQYRERVRWPDPVVAGIGAWLAGLLVTAVPLWWFSLTDSLAVGKLELAVLVLVEGAGGTVNRGELAATLSAYGARDGTMFGVGPAVSTLVPAVVVLAGGYSLADRHIEAGTARRPLDAVLAGASLAPWFVATLALSALVTEATVEGTVSVDVPKLVAVGLLYAGVFATAGGALRARTRLTSSRGLLAGVGAFVVAVSVWLAVERPPTDPPADGFAGFDGAVEVLGLLRLFVVEHGIGESEILPAWFVVLVPLGVGASLARVAGRDDPAVGAGEGARLGVTYGGLVFLVVVGHLVVLAGELSRGGGWTAEEIRQVSQLGAVAPRTVLLAGVVYPATFAAIGGAVGARLRGAIRDR